MGFTALVISIAAIIIVLAIIAIPMMKKKYANIKKTGKYPEGHFMGIGIALGIPLGIPLAIATDNFGLLGAGVAIGVAIGAGMEADAKKKGKIRPLTKEEMKQRQILMWVGLGLFLLGLAVFLTTFLLTK